MLLQSIHSWYCYISEVALIKTSQLEVPQTSLFKLCLVVIVILLSTLSKIRKEKILSEFKRGNSSTMGTKYNQVLWI